MALQQVVKATIICFDESYINRFEHRLTEKSLKCRSCSIDFEHGDLLFSDINTRGSWDKRHLACAIFHHVIDLKEAKEIAAKKGLEVNWREIHQEMTDLYDSRKKMFARLACLALAVSMFGVNFLSTLQL